MEIRTAMVGSRAGRVLRRGPGFAGALGAVVLFCLSLTPSLLPRHWAVQGVLSGVLMAFGYATGAVLGAAARAAFARLPSQRSAASSGSGTPRHPGSVRAWLLLAGAGGAMAVVFLVLGHTWQAELRRQVGAAPAAVGEPLLVVVVAVAVFGLLLLAARAVRLLTRVLAAVLARVGPRPVALVAAASLVAGFGYAVGQGVVVTGFMQLAGRAAESANAAVAPDLARPDSAHVSGGPGSLAQWEDLGRFGREFTAGAVPIQQLAAFSADRPVRPPIRVYIGRDSAANEADQAKLAVAELERTGAFDRSVLAVIVTTGTGWVNPAVPAALEYLYGGDSAVVATQYSYLPSWISFLADRAPSTVAAAGLVGAVQERLAAMPPDQRPRLVVYGESLGAYAIEAALGSLDMLLADVDAAVLAGPPFASPVWRQLVADREPGSPVWRPAHPAESAVRFAQDPADLAGGPDRPQLVYLQNATDPVVWWSPDLLYRRPAWLAGDRGPGVSGAMRWFPVVTFVQVTLDGPTASLAPPGYGHHYLGMIVDAWAAVAPPPGWTDVDTAQLRALLVQELAEERDGL